MATELITTQTVGGNTDFGPFAIEYLNITDIKVSLNGVDQTLTTHYTIDEPTSTVTFVTAPDVDDVIRIYRETPIDSPEAVYAPGSAIRAQNLNDNTDQALFALQELKEQYVTRSNGAFDTDVDLQTHKLTNVGDPTNPQDAVTKQYLEDNYFDDDTETILSTEGWVSSDTHIATTQAIENRFLDREGDLTESGESWVDNDDNVATTQAITNITNLRHDTIVQLAEPTTTVVGKTWLQNDVDLTLHIWDGSEWRPVASGGSFQELQNVVYVDAVNGEDTFDGGENNDGHRISRPKQTISGAIQQINDEEAHGSIVVVLPGIYAENLPIDIEADNVAIIGESLRNCIVHPLVPADHDYAVDGPHANELASMFRVNSGTYVANLTLMGMKADGAFGVSTIDPHPTHGLPASQGWNFSFFPGAFIAKSPYIQNCTNFSDSAIDNRTGFFDPHAKTVVTNPGPPVVTGPAPGFAQDSVSEPTGGGILVDGSVPDGDSPLRSMVCDSYTHVGLNGPGILVANNGYCQATSSYAFFNRYHLKCLNGGQANLAASTTDFGDFSLIAEGRSPEPVFTGEVVGQIASGGPVTTTFNVDTFTAATDLYANPADPKAWFGSATRPQDNMVVELEGTWYEVLSSSTTDGGTTWNVEILRFSTTPGDSRADNLGLDLTSTIPDNAVASFYLRSQVASSGHTMEYVGSGTDYTALPENGGQVVDANQITEVEANVGELPGKVYTAITDQNGNFKVGPLEVNQRNNTITIEAGAGTLFAVSGDVNPQLGGNLDANGFDIIADTGSAVAPSITFTGETTSGLFNGGANSVNITTNAVERAEFGPTEVVFNDGGEDYDFRVEGDTEANLFVVDASADAIDINGATTVSGSVTIDNGGDLHVGNNAIVVGNSGAATFSGVGVNDTGSAEISLLNTDAEDTDGGRDSIVRFSGTESGGIGVSTLAAIEASHDGTANDEAGQLTISTNDGADGNAPTVAVTIDSNQDVTLANDLTVGNDLTVTGNTVTPQINGYNQTAAGEGGRSIRKNFIDNGEFAVDYRASSGWVADRWEFRGFNFVTATAVKQRLVSTDTTLPEGFMASGGCTISAAETTLNNDRLLYITQNIEAVNLAPLEPGTAGARSMTLSFWVRSNKAGNYGVNLWKNNDGTNQRIRGATFNISAAEASANDWVHRSITFEGDTAAAGGFAFNTNRGYQLGFILEAGSTWLADISSWQDYSTVNQNFVDDGHDVDFTDSTANNILFTGIQLEVGDVATPYEFRQWDDEQYTCFRYFENIAGNAYTSYPPSGAYSYVTWHFKARKRQTTPTVSLNTNGTAYGAAADNVSAYLLSANVYITSTSTVDAETDWT